MLSSEVGVEQGAEALDFAAVREHARLALDVLGTAVGLGRPGEIAERLEIRRRLGELRTPRRRHRNRHRAGEDREGARPSHAGRLIRPSSALEEPGRPHEVAAELRAPRERERSGPTEESIQKIGQTHEPTLSPLAPWWPSARSSSKEIFSDGPFGC